MTTDIYSGNLAKHYLYQTWAGIKTRCHNTKCSKFKYYGGIGITMFSEWINDSRAFLMWVDSNLRIET